MIIARTKVVQGEQYEKSRRFRPGEGGKLE